MAEPTKPKYSMETSIKIWNDATGYHLSVGPDRDGLDLVEIRCVAADGKEERQLTLTVEESLMLATAINKLYGKE